MSKNTVKKYIVQFELGPSTRWLIEPEDELAALKMLAENLGASFTAGPRPAITVIKEERRPAPAPDYAIECQKIGITPTTN